MCAPPFCQLLLEAAAALSPEGLEDPSDEDDDEELSLEEDELSLEDDPLSPDELELLFEPRLSVL
jgi:hypothetical protein